MLATSNRTKEKFERLLSRFLDNKVVPFLGAGVSNDAECEDGYSDVAKVKTWKNKLIEAICSKIKELENGKQWYAWCCNYENCSKVTSKSCVNGAESKKYKPPKCETLSLGQLCETYIWLHGDYGQRALVREVLEIEKLVKMIPCPAHYYIAFLAREGLIDEVITTNYDTCMERAYADTFPVPYDDKNKSPAVVIANLEDYREKATKSFIENRMSCLKIYKINGCARNLLNLSGKEENILLTERQLQDWRERHWARDFFRDRLRSRTIIFSGFGSDEPQVRHTALQVVEEFQMINPPTEAGGNGNLYWWERPNAPYIAAYDDHLSFNQLQILYAYIQAHSNSPTIEEVYFKNAFTAVDLSFFVGENNELDTKLRADLFWERIFQGIFKKLLIRYCSRDSIAVAYLSGIFPAAEIIFQQMLEWFVPGDKPFGAFPAILSLKKENNNVMTLARLVWYAKYKGKPPAGWYASLKDEPFLIPFLLLLIFLAVGENGGEQEIAAKVSTEKELLSITFFSNNHKVKALIAHPERAFQNQELVDLPDDFKQRNIVQIIISEGLREKPRRQRIKISSTDNRCKRCKQMYISSVYQIPLRELFRNAYVASANINKLRSIFCENLKKVVLLYDEARPHLSRRDRVKPI
ncbi:SIR2-like domain protein [Neomoorella glycerini]|uniref:SIR2-like domain protein n=1 Tax=Neomoorella glycerini TaxID=55779 RepID=A0A6I5ZSG8_9FIRM|nr:SIR2 family protein [Moorella glycerini]QGP92659.1 SIR2-like domain protein [Moorella glycerini]